MSLFYSALTGNNRDDVKPGSDFISKMRTYKFLLVFDIFLIFKCTKKNVLIIVLIFTRGNTKIKRAKFDPTTSLFSTSIILFVQEFRSRTERIISLFCVNFTFFVWFWSVFVDRAISAFGQRRLERVAAAGCSAKFGHRQS